MIDKDILTLLINKLDVIILALATLASVLWNGWNARKAKEQSRVNGISMDLHAEQMLNKVDEVQKTVNGNTEKLQKDSNELYHIKEKEKEKEG